jgi:DNA-binding NarL/FixJ family response regulator
MKPKRVLLVDDNQEFLHAAKSFLRAMPGFELAGAATTAEQALELTAALHPDLVLMDISMPGMNGLAATRRIKQQPDAPKVVVVTLHSRSEFGVPANKAGADGFVQKDHFVDELPPLLVALFPAGTAPPRRA